MEKIFCAEKFKEIERQEIAKLSDRDHLIKKAAAAAFAEINIRCKEQQKFSFFIGPGYNGIDALFLAKLLNEANKIVRIIIIEDMSNLTKSYLQKLDIDAKDLEVFHDNIIIEQTDIIIDAIFGIGLNRELNHHYLKIIKFINQNNNFVIALDVPTGLAAFSGEKLGDIVKANITISFIANKLGLISKYGKDYCGQIIIKDININLRQYQEDINNISKSDLNDFLSKRAEYSNKGTYGKLIIIGGNKNMPGSIILAGKTAMRMGVGKVFILSDLSNKDLIISNLPEAIFCTKSDLKQLLENSDACLIGPGLGLSHSFIDNITDIFTYPINKVIDADGLNILAKNNIIPKQAILTPHLLEAARLLDQDLESVKKDPITSTNNLASKYSSYINLKSEVNYLKTKDKFFISSLGNNALAKSGSGDVLAALTASILAQEKDFTKALISSSIIHGYAAHLWSKDNAKRSMLASDIISNLPIILKQLLK